MHPDPSLSAPRGENGFTLVEVLIALTIFAIGMLGVAAMQITGIQGNATAKWHTQSSSWATAEVERLMTLPYGHADLAAGAHSPVTREHYTVSWSVTEDDPIDNVKTLAVTVNWDDRGTGKNTRFTYYRANL
jgi:type IV pilus assembly protein PilV